LDFKLGDCEVPGAGDAVGLVEIFGSTDLLEPPAKIRDAVGELEPLSVVANAVGSGTPLYKRA
jgi:hypothetical protein